MKLWILLLFAGAAATGGATRYVLAAAIDRRWGDRFPLGTLAVNLSGALLMGALVAWLGLLPAANAASSATPWLLLGVGFVGSYTTVSAFSLQTLNLLQQRRLLPAAGYVAASMLLCPLALWLGWLLATWVQ